jgi:sulfoquinovosidase
VLWESLPNVAFVGAAPGVAAIREYGTPQGSFDIRDQLVKRCDRQSVDAAQLAADNLALRGTLTGQECAIRYELTFRAVSANQLQFALKLAEANDTGGYNAFSVGILGKMVSIIARDKN